MGFFTIVQKHKCVNVNVFVYTCGFLTTAKIWPRLVPAALRKMSLGRK